MVARLMCKRHALAASHRPDTLCAATAGTFPAARTHHGHSLARMHQAGLWSLRHLRRASPRQCSAARLALLQTSGATGFWEETATAPSKRQVRDFAGSMSLQNGIAVGEAAIWRLQGHANLGLGPSTSDAERVAVTCWLRQTNEKCVGTIARSNLCVQLAGWPSGTRELIKLCIGEQCLTIPDPCFQESQALGDCVALGLLGLLILALSVCGSSGRGAADEQPNLCGHPENLGNGRKAAARGIHRGCAPSLRGDLHADICAILWTLTGSTFEFSQSSANFSCLHRMCGPRWHREAEAKSPYQCSPAELPQSGASSCAAARERARWGATAVEVKQPIRQLFAAVPPPSSPPAWPIKGNVSTLPTECKCLPGSRGRRLRCLLHVQ